MISEQELQLVLENNLGNRITPELLRGMLASLSKPEQLLVDASGIDSETYLEYVFVRSPFEVALPAIKTLHQDHWDEMESERPQFSPNYDLGAQLCNSGRMVQFLVGVGETGEVVGQMAWMISTSHHTGKIIATEDSLFIRKDHRGGALAIRFLKYCARALQSVGATELFAGTRVSNKAHVLYKRAGFEHISNLFRKDITGERPCAVEPK